MLHQLLRRSPSRAAAAAATAGGLSALTVYSSSDGNGLRFVSSAAPAPLLQQTSSATPLLFCWGRLVPASDVQTAVSLKVRNPTPIGFFESQGLKVKQLSYGGAHGAALDEKGKLWAWGEAAGPVPTELPCGGATITSVASTAESLYAVTSRGHVLEVRQLG